MREQEGDSMAVTLEVDTKGKPRPMPTMGAVKGLDYLDIGEVMEIIFDDPLCAGDLQNWALLNHHQFLGSWEGAGRFSVKIRRLH